jgi:hypothetical protein
MPRGIRTPWIERSFLPTFTFDSLDVVVVLGQDGLVVNAAKYLDGQPVVVLNPDRRESRPLKRRGHKQIAASA